MHIEQSLADGIKELETLLYNNKIVKNELYKKIVQKFINAGIPPEFLIEEFTTPKGTRSDGKFEFPILRVDAKLNMINNTLYRIKNSGDINKELKIIVNYFLPLIVYVEIGFVGYRNFAKDTFATRFETHENRGTDAVLKEGLPRYNTTLIRVKNLFSENLDTITEILPEWAKKLDFFKELMTHTNK